MDSETTTPRPAAANREDFAELARMVRDSGLLTRRRGYYQLKIGTTVGALVALAGVALVIGNSWWNVVVAVGLAFILVQLGFIGHDAGHRQICARRRDNDVVGLVVTNLLTGFSFSWWLAKHNRHHAHPNRPDQDPDMAPGALAYTRDQVDARGQLRPAVRQRPGRCVGATAVSRSAQPARGQCEVARRAQGSRRNRRGARS